jgi:hypothetical protein
MPGSWDPSLLPSLTSQNCVITSPSSRGYNCIAWAANDQIKWWWPDSTNLYYWPRNVPRQVTVDAFVRAYETIGYVPCADGAMEEGFEKIVLYAKHMPWGDMEPTHAARQLPDGQWTSKLGPSEDITHATVADLDGRAYGTAVRFLKRPK